MSAAVPRGHPVGSCWRWHRTVVAAADEDSCGSPVDVDNRRVVAETGAYLGRPQIRALATMGRVDFCCPCWRLVERIIRETIL